MPRPRTGIHYYFEECDNDSVICNHDSCEGRILRKHAGNMERHLRIFHQSTYQIFLEQKGNTSIEGRSQPIITKVEMGEEQFKPSIKSTPRVPDRTPRQSSQNPKPMLNLIEKATELWSIKLQNMDPTQALFAEKLINDIISNGQLGRLNQNSTIQVGIKMSDPLGSVSFQNGPCSDGSTTLMREEFLDMNQQQKHSFD